MNTQRLKVAEGLVVGPGDVLVVRLKPWGNREQEQAIAAEIKAALDAIGLDRRSLVLCGEAEFAVVERELA